MSFANNGRKVGATVGLFAIFVVSGILVARGDNKAMTTETRNPRSAETTALAQTTAGKPTAEDARRFVEAAENRLLPLWVAAQRSSWGQETFITPDAEEIAAEGD